MKGYNGSGAAPGEGILNDPRYWGADDDSDSRYPDKDTMIDAILRNVGGDIPTLEDWAGAWLETKSYAELYDAFRRFTED